MPFSGLELLSTVHWIRKHHPTIDAGELIDKVHAWSPRKKQFSDRQIRLASEVLCERGWLPPLN